ncbi:hypothetical protein [Nostoc sp. DedQUE09]|nr:hypothetical protein [Nostoc sp. DedQUE09]MDZ7955784.1 hypothetical protein [Nostoc sp. DedQUE09]
MENNKEYHMSSDEFRHWGYQTIDWIANYLETVEQLPVLQHIRSL